MDNSNLLKIRLFVDQLESLDDELQEQGGLSSIFTNNGTIWLSHKGSIPDATTEIYAITMIPVEDDCADAFLSVEAAETYAQYIGWQQED